MDQMILTVQKMQDYIDEHYSKTITLMDLSKVTHYSPLYSARLFNEQCGYSPIEYIQKIRLRESALLLLAKKKKVIDVCNQSGFDSVDGFQRPFKKEDGCNPKAYQVHPVPIPLFTVYGVKFKNKIKE